MKDRRCGIAPTEITIGHSKGELEYGKTAKYRIDGS